MNLPNCVVAIDSTLVNRQFSCCIVGKPSSKNRAAAGSHLAASHEGTSSDRCWTSDSRFVRLFVLWSCSTTIITKVSAPRARCVDGDVTPGVQGRAPGVDSVGSGHATSRDVAADHGSRRFRRRSSSLVRGVRIDVFAVRLLVDPRVSPVLQFQSQFLAAGLGDTTVNDHVYLVGYDVVE